MVKRYLFEQMDADPERYAREFSKRWELVERGSGEFDGTDAIMAAWFCALADAVREKTLEEHARSIALLGRSGPVADKPVVITDRDRGEL